MDDFTLDTSGSIVTDNGKHTWTEVSWSDLTAFQQGRVEGLLREFSDTLTNGLAEPLMVGFSDLAPPALDRIITDCGWLAALHNLDGSSAEIGRFVWDSQQRGLLPGFPPQTPYLADDGKIHLREAA